jgi:hypothetical protein
MVPQVAPEQPGPASVHVTFVFALPVTVAVNGCVVDTLKVCDVGEMEIATGVSVTVAVADFVPSAWDVAVTVTVFGEGAVGGAV